MLVHYIKELLFKHDCVVIPGFGGLIARYEGASIHPVKNSLLPPRKKLAFNKSLQDSDGLLENTISRMEDISLDEANIQLKVFVAKILEGIEDLGYYKLQGIGKFYFNEEMSIQFEADEKENFLEESYSLPELYFKPIEREENEMSKVPPRPRPVVRRPAGHPAARPTNARPQAAKVTKQRPSKPPKAPKEKKEREANKQPIFIILPIIFIIAAVAGSLVVKFGGSDTSQAGLGPDSSVVETNHVEVTGDSEVLSNENTTVEEEISTVEESVVVTPTDVEENVQPVEEEVVLETTSEEVIPEKIEEKEPDPVVETTITESSGRFHIIAGSFRDRANAEKLVRRLGTGTILDPKGSSSLIKVSVKSYNSWGAANADIGNLEGTYGSGIWVYKH